MIELKDLKEKKEIWRVYYTFSRHIENYVIKKINNKSISCINGKVIYFYDLRLYFASKEEAIKDSIEKHKEDVKECKQKIKLDLKEIEQLKTMIKKRCNQ